jgi:hypothetical protein
MHFLVCAALLGYDRENWDRFSGPKRSFANLETFLQKCDLKTQIASRMF